jgi:hypothetical protein
MDAAFAPTSTSNFGPAAKPNNPYFWSHKLPELVCPTFPGEEEVAPFGQIPNTAGLRVATGNYVAVPATHYRSSPAGHLESGPPSAVGTDCSGKFCGNGALPFPGIIGGKVQKSGLPLGSLTDGASRTVLITESREEVVTSWYSGLASYVVGAMPEPNGAVPGAAASKNSAADGLDDKAYWSCANIPGCRSALNQGDPKGIKTTWFYQPTSPHGSLPRVWGPSSRHPGVVMHGYADAHVQSETDNIDADVYLSLITRGNAPE